MQYRDGVLWAVESWRGKKAGWQVIELFVFGYDAEQWLKRCNERRIGPKGDMRLVKYTRTPNAGREGTGKP